MALRDAFGRQALWGLVFTNFVLAATAVERPGAIPALFRVGDQGNATYTIPIEAPESAGGLRPNLALAYNHLTGDGLAGMRWTLAGFSSITRCARTYAQDNVTAAFSYASDDKLCLDGQRLVEYAGPYGASGTQYRTEIETFQKITQENTQGNGAMQFRVDHGNGWHSYYGATPTSRVEAIGKGGSVRAWYLSYTEDQFQNRISYEYSENASTGEVFPTYVSWTANAARGLSPRYGVEIIYEDRPLEDQRSGYDAGGAPWATTKRIDRIRVVWNGDQTIRTYELTYATPIATGTQRSQLASVSLCAALDCLPQTTFAVQNGQAGWGPLNGISYGSGTDPRVGDWNGDGRQDIFVVLSGTWQVWWGRSHGNLDDFPVDSGVSAATNPAAARVLDYNGDGLSDLLYQSSAEWRVLVSTGTGFTDSATGVPITAPNHADIRDFDGDGLGDWLYRDGNDIKWRRNSGAGFASPETLISGQGDAPWWVENEAAPDLNGDGRDDLIYRSTVCLDNPFPPPDCVEVAAWRVLLAVGSGYTEIALLQGTFTQAMGNFRSIDVNGDGLDDIAYTYGSSTFNWYTQLSNGTGLEPAVNTGISGSYSG